MNKAGPAPLPGEVSMGRIVGAAIAGYVAAAFAASMTFLFGIWIVAEDMRAVSPALVVAGTVFAMLYALPGYVVVRSVLSWAQVGSVPVFALSAGCAALATLTLPHLMFNGGKLGLVEPAVAVVTFLAGAVAGGIYRVVERLIRNRG